MNYTILGNELEADPLVRGYSGMTDAEAAADLNTVYRAITATHLSGSDIYENIDNVEFLAKTAAQQQEVWDIIHLGDSIDVQPGSKARTRFVALFTAGSDTIIDLLAFLQTLVSRATELGIAGVKTSDIYKARN